MRTGIEFSLGLNTAREGGVWGVVNTLKNRCIYGAEQDSGLMDLTIWIIWKQVRSGNRDRVKQCIEAGRSECTLKLP